jgi:hypothetical protein
MQICALSPGCDRHLHLVSVEWKSGMEWKRWNGERTPCLNTLTKYSAFRVVARCYLSLVTPEANLKAYPNRMQLSNDNFGSVRLLLHTNIDPIRSP